MPLSTSQMPLFEPRPLLHRRASVDVHALSIPARSFTGDFYFTHRASDRLWFALGDVAGKGIGAAVFMAMIQEELEQRITSCASTACDPAVTTARLDAYLKPLLPPNRFASAVIGHVDDRGNVSIVNAGHCPPLIAHRDGTATAIDSTGPVLGILPGARWTTATHRLEHGESLLAYSDGVIEAQADDDDFGIQRLERAFLQARHGTARHVAQSVERSVREFAPRYDDDLTIVVACRR